MSWHDNQSPWGKPRGPQSLEELFAILAQKVKEAFGGPGAGDKGNGGDDGRPRPARPAGPRLGRLSLFIVLILLLSMVNSLYYTIRPSERGVVLRFGKFLKSTDPGLNFKLPLVDEVVKVDIEAVRKEEFGFRTTVAAQRSTFEKTGYNAESLMLTADKNVIDVEWIVQYKVRDPFAFIFKVENVKQAVRDVSETVMRRIVGNMDFDYVLSNRDLLAAASAREIQTALDRYESGVDIVTVQLQDVNPPDPVKPAFNEVNEADQDMKRLVNEAEEAYNRVIPKARGDAKRIVEEARGYAIERVNESRGNASRFVAVLKEYQAAKDVTRMRMYLETMEEILPNVEEIYVMDRNGGGVLPLLDLRSERRAPAAAPAAN